MLTGTKTFPSTCSISALKRSSLSSEMTSRKGTGQVKRERRKYIPTERMLWSGFLTIIWSAQINVSCRSLLSFHFLSRSFRSSSRSYEEVEKSIENSLCFGLYQDRRQIGFARIISDLSTVYLLADVFVLEEHRGSGKWLLECITALPDLKNLIGFLATKRDAQGLYKKYGFRTLDNPKIMMLRIPIVRGLREGKSTEKPHLTARASRRDRLLPHRANRTAAPHLNAPPDPFLCPCFDHGLDMLTNDYTSCSGGARHAGIGNNTALIVIDVQPEFIRCNVRKGRTFRSISAA